MIDERISLERERIREKLEDKATPDEEYKLLYAAQQALGWAADPELAASPFDVIMAGKVWAPIRDE